MEVITAIIAILCSIIPFAIVYGFQKYLRPRLSSRVVCWFCGSKTTVPYGNINCWDCPDCEQYNGFNKDGDYNKPIPAQYDERLNNPVTGIEDEYIGGDSVLCDRCQQNTLLKVKQLANFVPYNEKKYMYEVEAFERHLEKVYRLCLACEIKVQHELHLQNEAIARRLHNLDHTNESFCQDHIDNQTFLHASYTDKTRNRYITASVILHALSLVCGVGLLFRNINLTTAETHISQWLVLLHPVLAWLDRHVDMLVVVGLLSALAAKLCLGKYRLHIIDAISCPVWLLVLLSQTGYISLHQSGSLYTVLSQTGNCITCIVCLGVNRRRRNQSNMSMTRLSMDERDSSTVSSISPYSSVSQVGRPYPLSHDQHRSHDQLMSHDMLQTGSGDSRFNNREAVNTHEEREATPKAEGQNDHHSNLASAASELDAISLGEPGLKRNDSGIFSTVSQSSFLSNLNNQSVSQNLRSRDVYQSRPLISPAAFSHMSTPDRHRSSPVPSHGLFSVPLSTSSPLSFTDRPSLSTGPSAFRSTNLFSTERHSFTPERPTTPITTSFGISPFINLQTSSLGQGQGSFSRCGTSSLSSFSVARQQGSTVAKQSNVLPRDQQVYGNDDEDRMSDFTSITSRCPVDSTTDSKIPKQQKAPIWYHPGFIGFILGGSVVANVILLLQAVWVGDS